MNRRVAWKVWWKCCRGTSRNRQDTINRAASFLRGRHLRYNIPHAHCCGPTYDGKSLASRGDYCGKVLHVGGGPCLLHPAAVFDPRTEPDRICSGLCARRVRKSDRRRLLQESRKAVKR